MRIIKAFKDWWAARQEVAKERVDARVRQPFGGARVYEQEATERAERENAVAISHQRAKAAFQLPTNLKDAPYTIIPANEYPALDSDLFAETLDPEVAPKQKLLDSPLHVIRKVTLLYPWSVERNFIYSDSPHQRGADDLVGFEPRPYRTAEGRANKSYELLPQIIGIRHFTAELDEMGYNISPFIGFSYYHRRLHNWISPRGYKDKYGFTGGIETRALQFGAIIHDGYELDQSHVQRDAAGFERTALRYALKFPTRLCVLGELGLSGDEMRIYRMLIDEKPVKLTQRNIMIGLEYAEALVEDIVGGKKYDPSLALRKAHSRAFARSRAQNPDPS
jgi:hypothetical protein